MRTNNIDATSFRCLTQYSNIIFLYTKVYDMEDEHYDYHIKDFLNELVKQYNIDAIKDKNEVSQKTKVFIDERLSSIGNDLNTIQDRVKKFKIDNAITGLSAEGELALEAASLNNEKLIQIKK